MTDQGNQRNIVKSHQKSLVTKTKSPHPKFFKLNTPNLNFYLHFKCIYENRAFHLENDE